jgi:hypothetical protein
VPLTCGSCAFDDEAQCRNTVKCPMELIPRFDSRFNKRMNSLKRLCASHFCHATENDCLFRIYTLPDSSEHRLRAVVYFTALQF